MEDKRNIFSTFCGKFIVIIVVVVAIYLPIDNFLLKPSKLAYEFVLIKTESDERLNLFQNWKKSVPKDHPLQSVINDGSLLEMYYTYNQAGTTFMKTTAELAKQNLFGKIIVSKLESSVREDVESFNVKVNGKSIEVFRLKLGEKISFTFNKVNDEIQIKYIPHRILDLNEFAMTFTDKSEISHTIDGVLEAIGVGETTLNIVYKGYWFRVKVIVEPQ